MRITIDNGDEENLYKDAGIYTFRRIINNNYKRIFNILRNEGS